MKISLSQASYAKYILKTFKIDECNPTYTPMEANLRFKDVGELYEDSTEFRKLLGSLRYLTHARVKLMFGVGYLIHVMV